ncbi:MAG: M20/M25/M40 family metallo-hydrolase [Sphingobium sp.]
MKMGQGAALVLALALTAGQGALAAPLRPDQAAFREIYRELVETDSSAPAGSCTLAAERMLARLKGAGFGAAQAELFVPEGRPRDGGLIARIDGSDPDARAMLLVDHIDVVAARREDWPRDPFKLAEEGGYFIGRGVIDDKALSAIWIDSLIRMKKEGFRPRRTIKVALTCGEESGDAVNGVQWLLRHRRDAVEAGFALNEGGYGMTDAAGKPIALYLAVGEKHSQTFTIEARNSGGHSSRPRPDNAIYDLADALTAIRRYSFPIRLNATNRGYFTRMAPIIGGDMGQAMAAVGKGEAGPQAMAKVTGDVTYNAMLRTTCVATQVEAGHAINALPQRARATIQCRLFPGEKPEEVEAQLRTVIGNPAITLSRAEGEDRTVAVPPPLDPAVMGPAEEIARQQFPGIPVVPNLLTAGTDGRYLSAAGIPTYGVPGIFLDPDGNGAHGVNERVRVKSVYDGRDYLYALIKRYAGSR